MTSVTNLDDPNRHVKYHAEHVSATSSTDYPGYDPDNQYLWDLEDFKKKLSLTVHTISNVSIEFDLVGVDASIANALRRILLAEVPTMAIEQVYMYDNTSVVQDEVLAQRLGLVPLQANPKAFDYLDMTVPEDDRGNDRNTLVFEIDVTCSRVKKPPVGSTDPNEIYINSNVTSGDIVWLPQGEQENLPMFQETPPRPALKNILLSKLRPGQRIHAQLHAVKGRGEQHAKWSPVATASYRLLPLINIISPIPRPLLRKFQSCFPEGVINIRKNPRTGEDEEAVVADARRDTMSREVLRHPEFEGLVEIRRVRDFFLFKIESAGNIGPDQLFKDSVDVMRAKIQLLKKDIRTHLLPKLEQQDTPMEES